MAYTNIYAYQFIHLYGQHIKKPNIGAGKAIAKQAASLGKALEQENLEYENQLVAAYRRFHKHPDFLNRYQQDDIEEMALDEGQNFLFWLEDQCTHGQPYLPQKTIQAIESLLLVYEKVEENLDNLWVMGGLRLAGINAEAIRILGADLRRQVSQPFSKVIIP